MVPLIGNLDESPPLDKLLHINDIVALTFLLAHSRVPWDQRSIVADIIEERKVMLLVELATVRPALDLEVRAFHHQLRARDDQQTGQIAVEQWIPSEQCWLVNGYFPYSHTDEQVLDALRAGDPRRKSGDEFSLEVRQRAQANAKAHDAASTERVLGAVDSLSVRALDDMIAVEEALHTGETITMRGDDRQFLDKALDKTQRAAAAGDIQAQAVLSGGVRDTHLCVNPGDNPLNR